jgi:hypothetical protein
MTTKLPRATTKGEGKRKPRAPTQGGGDRAARDKLRSSSVVPTDQYLRIADADVVDVIEELAPPGVPPLRLLVLEAAAHLPAATAAITEAGHVVVRGASGTPGLGKILPALAEAVAAGQLDAVLAALPGGEPLIEAVLAYGAARPVIIAASTTSGAEAARRAAAIGADLATVRPHDLERLAPVLLAAARLVEQRRGGAARSSSVGGVLDDLGRPDSLGDYDLDAAADPDSALQPLARFLDAVEETLERAQRFAYPLSLAIFELAVAPPPPPAGVRGILRARTGNALVHAVRDIDLVTELEQDRFAVLLPYTDRLAAAEVARKIISAVAAADPVVASGRSLAPRVIGAIASIRGGEARTAADLMRDATQLLEQTAVTGASLAVET